MKAIKTTWQSISVLAVTFLIASISSNTFAQTAGEESADADESALEEVYVTAQRRETNLQRTALAVDVLSGQELINRGVDSLTAIQYATPSLLISDFGSANVFNIRGIGRTKVDIEIPSGVVIYADGVPTLAGYFQNEPYFDMASVEVLRGPQGTFVGKSASGGAIFANTRNPELGESGGNFEVGFGEHDLFAAKGVINIPASDTVAFRIAVNFVDRDHYYDAITGPYTGTPGERNLKSLRVGMLYAPNDQTQVLLKLSAADLDFGGNVTSSFGDPVFSVHQDAPFAYTDESTRVVLDIDYTMGNGIKFSSLTGLQDLDTVNNLDINASNETPTYWFKSAGNIEMTSQEFNLVSPDDQKLRWVIGAFYQNQKSELLPVDQFGFTFIGSDVFGFQLPTDFPWLGSPWIKDEDDVAVFAHIAFDIDTNLEMEIGVRYSDYEMSQTTDYVLGFGSAPPVIPFGSGPGPDTQLLSENSTDWKIGLNWTKDDSNFLYALVSRGHTTGSVNIFPPFDPYKEMEVQNLEGGWKAEFRGGQVTTQLSVYYENIEGYQSAFTDLDLPNSAGQVQNASTDSTIYGIEFTSQANLENVSLDFGISFNESELGNFDNVVHPLTLETVNLSGAKFPLAPDFTANIGVEWRSELSNGMAVIPRFDFSHNAETQADLFPAPEFTLESRTLLNLQLRLEKDDWHVVFWATNATDEEYIGAIQNNGSLRYAAPPRQMGIRFGKSL